MARELSFSHPFRALQYGGFRIIWIGLIVSQAGYWLSSVSLQVAITRLGGNTPLAQGLLLFLVLLPNLVLSPLAGVLADLYNRQRLALASQAGISAVALLMCLALQLRAGGLGAIYLLALCLGLAMCLGQPAMQAIVADSVPRSEIRSAVALQNIAFNISRVGGPALAAPVVLLGGPQSAFAIYFVGASTTAFLISRVSLPARAGPPASRWKQHLEAGVRHAVSRPPAVMILATVAVTGMCAGGYQAVLPLVARNLGWGDRGFFSLVVALGVGAAFGLLLIGLFHRGQSREFAVALMLGIAAAEVAMGLTATRWSAVLATAAFGALFFAFMAGQANSLQQLVADPYRGRVMSLYILGWAGLAPIGALLMGALGNAIGTDRTLIVMGAACAAAAAGVAAGRLRRPAPSARLTVPPRAE